LEILGITLWKRVSYWKSFKNGAFLFLVRDERVDNVHPKFHIIPIIFEFLVILAIHGGEDN